MNKLFVLILVIVLFFTLGCVESPSKSDFDERLIVCFENKSMKESNDILWSIVFEKEEARGSEAETTFGKVVCDSNNIDLFPISYNISRETGLDFVALAKIQWHVGTNGLSKAINQTLLNDDLKEKYIDYAKNYY